MDKNFQKYIIDKAVLKDCDYVDQDLLVIDGIREVGKGAPDRSKFNVILFCTAGKVQFNVNGTPTALEKMNLLLCPTGTTFSDIMASPDIELKLLCVSDALLLSILRDKMSVWNELLYIHKMHVIPIKKEESGFLFNLYSGMQDILAMKEEDLPYRREIIHSLLSCCVYRLCGILKKMLPEREKRPMSHSDSLFQQFLELLSTTRPKRQPVEYYASKLFISSKYLSSICKKNSNKTAGQWITDHVMDDIRFYLKSTDLSIKEICTKLHFPNSSFFGKYVKEHFGMTPTQLRYSD